MKEISKLTYIILICFFFSCVKNNEQNKNINYYISVKINNNEKAGKGMFPSLPFDEGNYYSLRNKEISFTGGDYCFNYGGSIRFEENLSSIYWIAGNAAICFNSYEVSWRDTKTFASVEIIRNDNVIGGIIEGKINGICSRPEYITGDGRTYYYNFNISFKLKIVE